MPTALELYETKWTQAKRDKLPDSQFAGPNQSFPIADCSDVGDAWGLARSDAVRSKIKSIAKRLGLTSCLPKTAVESKETELEIIESGTPFATHLEDIRLLEAGANGKPRVMIIAAGTSNGVHGAVHYSKEMLMREASKFEHIPVFDNHLSPKEESDKPYRSIRDHLGYIDHPDYDSTPRSWAPEGGLVGELDVIEGNDWFDTRLKSRPDSVQFSIRASGLAGDALPGKPNVPNLQSFRSVKSCDAVMKAGAGGRVISLAEAAAEEMDMLLKDISLEELRSHPQWKEIERSVRESYISSDYDDKDPELAKWKTSMAKAKATGDKDAHDKLVEKIPSYHRHDMGECPFCNKKAAGMLPPGTPGESQVTESGKEDEDMTPEEMAKAIREAVNTAIDPLTKEIAAIRREQTSGTSRLRFQRRLAESGLPASVQGVVLEDLMEAAAEDLLPKDESKLNEYVDRRVARMKTLAFAPGKGAKASGQGAAATEIAEADREEVEATEAGGEDAENLESILAARVHNPNKPLASNTGKQEAITGVIAPTPQQLRVAEASGTAPARRPRNALEAVWASDDQPNVGAES
jgi:hypothetical protein